MAWIELDGAVNVRDLGGLPTQDGHRTAPGRLIRSDNLQDLSAADVVKLTRDLGVTTVVDLRGPAEISSEGPAPLDAVPGMHHVKLSVLPELGGNTDAVAEALLLKRARDFSRYPDDATCGHYLGYLEERPESVVGALRAIAFADGAALVHCAAGKDRTGVVAAMALSAVGVVPEAIVADYVATDERVEAIMGRLVSSGTYRDDLKDTVIDRHRPRPETMKAFLEQVHVRHGGVHQWLAGHGFDDPGLARLRARLVAG